MRIVDPDPAASDPSVSSDDTRTEENASRDKTSAFSRLLEKKREANQQSTQAAARKMKASDSGGATDPQVEVRNRLDVSAPASEVEGATIVEVPPEVQQLVREISVMVNRAGNQQVEITLDSNVLKGLVIRIERQNEAVNIQFQSASDDVARLVSRNVDSLTQGLSDRGITVGDIGISTSTVSPGKSSYPARSTVAQRWPRGRQTGGQ